MSDDNIDFKVGDTVRFSRSYKPNHENDRITSNFGVDFIIERILIFDDTNFMSFLRVKSTGESLDGGWNIVRLHKIREELLK